MVSILGRLRIAVGSVIHVRISKQMVLPAKFSRDQRNLAECFAPALLMLNKLFFLRVPAHVNAMVEADRMILYN